LTGSPTLLLITGPAGTGKSTLAAYAVDLLGACVLAWDWAMAPLRQFPTVRDAVEALPFEEYRRVGWSILWNLATAQLRDGRSVVLDGVARTPEKRWEPARGADLELDAVDPLAANLERLAAVFRRS
jgi:predicted kinase